MSTLLHISASPRGDHSESRRYGLALVRRLKERHPSLTVLRRDLYRDPLPHPDRDFAEASLMADAERRDAQRAALTLSDQLIGEVEAASVIAVDLPMHNFTLPSVLKAWVDHVVRPNRTFRRTQQGKVGLLADRPVYCVMACGGLVNDEATYQPDFATPYLRYVLATIGLHDVDFLALDCLSRGGDAVRQADVRFAEWLSRLPATQGCPSGISPV